MPKQRIVALKIDNARTVEKLAHDTSKTWTGSRYPLDPTVDAVEVLLTTGGMPMNARIEILQGPDTNKQAGPGNHAEAMAPRTLHRWCCFANDRMRGINFQCLLMLS